MIDIIIIVPLNDEVPLLGWSYGAAPESRVDVKSSGFRECRGVNDNVPDIVKSTPITPEIVYINLTVYR
jgi:hypothetical protein